MNYLFHLFLAGPDPALKLGNLMGDFVKGPLDSKYSPIITRGIRMHRSVDRYSHDHPIIRRSRQRLNPDLRHTRGLIIDIFYDHFLARNWETLHPEPLEIFVEGVYSILQQHFSQLPLLMQRIVPRMIDGNWLVSYRDQATIEIVLRRMEGRLSRSTGLGESAIELDRHYAGLQNDFFDFVPQVEDFIKGLDSST